MGNIITQTENDERSYIVNEAGDFQVKNKFSATTGTINDFTADTGTFNNVVYFKDNITIANNKTINDVDLPAFKKDYEDTKKQILDLSSGKFLNNLDLNVKSGNFTSITTSSIDVDGNIKAKEGTFSGLITANAGLNVNGAGGLTSTSGNFTDGVTTTTGKFSGMLSANGGLSGTSGKFTDGLTVEGTNGFTSTTGKFTGLLTADGGFKTSNANITGDLSGTTGNFTQLLIANGGLKTSDLSGTTGNFTGMLTAEGGVTASNANISGDLSGTTGKFTGLLSADGGLKANSANITGELSGASGNFKGLLTANGGIETSDLSGATGKFNDLTVEGGLTTNNANITGNLSGTTGNFSGLLSADDLKLNKNFIASGGLTLPNDSTLTLNGNMTGSGNINLGTTLQINQTTLPVFAGTNNKMSGNNGLVIKGANTWSIGEVKGTAGSSRLCFSYNDIPFACIDPATKNLVGVSKEW